TCDAVPAMIPVATAAAKWAPWLSAMKRVTGPEVKGIPTTQPPTAEPHRRAIRLAPPTSSGVRMSLRARTSAPPTQPRLRSRAGVRPTGEVSRLDAGLAQRAAHARRHLDRARAVAVQADGVDLAGAREANRLRSGGVGVEDGPGLVARRERSVRLEEAVGEAFAVGRDAGPARRRLELEPRLAHEPDAVRPGDPGHRVGHRRVVLAAVIQRAVRLDVRDRHDRGQGSDLEADQGFDVRRGQARLVATETRAVVVARMGADLDPALPAQSRGGDGDGRRAGVDGAGDAGAVDVLEDRLVRARTLAEIRVDVHAQRCAVSPWSSCTAWSS